MRGLVPAAAAVAALAIGACGSSQRITGTHAAHSTAAAQHGSLGGGSRPSAGDGICRTVARPRPKGPQHIPKPTARLDPAKRYTVTLHTNCGTIDIALAVKQAPAVAASFAYLVKLGFYDDLTFHRVVPGFVIQGGDPNGDGSGGPGYTVIERPPASLRYTRGVVAMAKSEAGAPGASGSQFFIVVGKNVGLPPDYALLGRVVGGWRTVAAISHVPTVAGPDGEGSSPATPVVIGSARLHVR